jgi:hypothetical protein
MIRIPLERPASPDSHPAWHFVIGLSLATLAYVFAAGVAAAQGWGW